MPKKTHRKKEVGYIVSSFSGIIKIQGLPHVFLHEVLCDARGTARAVAVGYQHDLVEAILFEDDYAGDALYRSEEVFSVAVSDHYAGRVLNGLGQPLDELGSIRGKKMPVFRQAPQIIERQPVTDPLTTGIKLIDSTLPIGRGQRELLIGDHKLGKTTIATDIVLNQRTADEEIFCVYVICGQKKDKAQHLISLLEKHDAMAYSLVILASSEDSFASQYLAPFVGCTIAEHFRDTGRDALIIYDDLSKHAKAYRDISLLLERAPGREAYPGDIFTLHGRLLERSAKLSDEQGGGSLTALPMIETQQGDITSFIPTNLISITDGQIYLERDLYQRGFLPAVNVGLSVSRVGSQAQPPALREVTHGIRLVLAQNKELQKIAKLETTVSEQATAEIHRGQLTLELLKQDKHTDVPWDEQVILFSMVEEGYFDDLEKDKWQSFESLLLELIRNRYKNVLKEIRSGRYTAKTKQKIKEIVEDFKQEWQPEKAT